jgi:hypothetical protein
MVTWELQILKGNQRGNVPFSSEQEYILKINMIIIVDVNFDYLVEIVFIIFLYCDITTLLLL